jgi:hypothetical protein
MTKPSAPNKAELREMLAEAVRNTQPQPVRDAQPEPRRGSTIEQIRDAKLAPTTMDVKKPRKAKKKPGK